MAKVAVAQHGVAINLACTAFGISETCYRYLAKAKRQAENEEIANWLIRLTDSNRNWGFGLCYRYLRNVKGFGWNHKRTRSARYRNSPPGGYGTRITNDPTWRWAASPLNSGWPWPHGL